MSRAVGEATLRAVEGAGVEIEYDTLADRYREAADGLIRGYETDAAFNGLDYDRGAEREQVATYADASAASQSRTPACRRGETRPSRPPKSATRREPTSRWRGIRGRGEQTGTRGRPTASGPRTRAPTPRRGGLMTGTPSVAARDDLAGVVDLFEWLTRAELSRALSELAFKQRAEVDDEAIAAAIDVAVAEYALVPAPPAALSEAGVGGDRATDPPTPPAGPTGPTPTRSRSRSARRRSPLPADAEDLPHILDVPERDVDRETLSEAVLERLSADAVAAIEAGDAERLEILADVTYDIEAWASVDAGAIRERIVAELDG